MILAWLCRFTHLSDYNFSFEISKDYPVIAYN